MDAGEVKPTTSETYVALQTSRLEAMGYTVETWADDCHVRISRPGGETEFMITERSLVEAMRYAVQFVEVIRAR